MGQKVVTFTPRFLQQLITGDETWFVLLDTIRTSRKLPGDATPAGNYYDPREEPDGTFIMTFEHPSWPDTPTDTLYAAFDSVPVGKRKK